MTEQVVSALPVALYDGADPHTDGVLFVEIIHNDGREPVVNRVLTSEDVRNMGHTFPYPDFRDAPLETRPYQTVTRLKLDDALRYYRFERASNVKCADQFWPMH